MKVRHAVILDDHRLFADLFSLMLEKYSLFEQVHPFYTDRDLTDFLLHLGREEVCIFLDYYLQEKNGISIMSEVKRLNKSAHIIFLTSTTSQSVVQNIMVSRPHGILSKFCDIATVIECIRHDSTKGVFLDTSIQQLLKEQQADAQHFTPRELELLRHFANGLSIADTAEKVSLSKHTVIAHRRKMMAKTKSNSIGQLIKYAQGHEFI